MDSGKCIIINEDNQKYLTAESNMKRKNAGSKKRDGLVICKIKLKTFFKQFDKIIMIAKNVQMQETGFKLDSKMKFYLK